MKLKNTMKNVIQNALVCSDNYNKTLQTEYLIDNRNLFLPYQEAESPGLECHHGWF